MLKDLRVFGLETSSYCNRHCANCQRTHYPKTRFVNGDKSKPIKEFLDDSKIYHVMDFLHKNKFNGRLQIFGFNEPTLDARLPTFLQYAHKKSLHVRMTTNGDELKRKPELRQQILPYIRELSIGIYDYDESNAHWPDKRNRLVSGWEDCINKEGYNSLRLRFSMKEKFTKSQRLLKKG